MREYEWAHTLAEDKLGVSGGRNGDANKLSGVRHIRSVNQVTGEVVISLDTGSRFFGGYQSGEGMIGGMPFLPGGTKDLILESFSGVHDFLARPWTYDSLGYNNVSQSVFGGRLAGGFGETFAKRFSESMAVVNLLPSAPVAAISLLPDIGITPILRRGP